MGQGSMTEPGHRPPILITGAPRSGTTWVGRMLDRSPEVGYINEPFNPTHQRGIFAGVFPHWYQYLDEGSAAGFEPAFRAMLAFRYDLAAQLRQRADRSTFEALVRDGRSFLIARWRRSRPLVKDPIAVFSSDWFSRTFGGHVVFLIRHPAAFAASVKRLGWTFPFDDLLAQDALIDAHLGGFEEELRAAARHRDPVDHATLMWRVVHTVAQRFLRDHPDWLVVRHEDLARDPREGFAQLFGRLGVHYSARIDRTVGWYSSGPLEGEPQAAEQEIRRHSLDTARRWRDRLTDEERSRIRARCEGLAAGYYADDEW